MSVEELKAAVSKLPAHELATFQSWFEGFMANQWDRQIERDMLSGRLDAALSRTDEHRRASRITPI
jgi:hypothetical protein